MSDPVTNNSGAYTLAKAAGGGRLVAAGTGDNTAITGKTIDRRGYGSCKVVVGYHCVLTDTKTLSLAVAYQESADGSSWDTAVALQAATVASTAANPTLEFNENVVFNVDLTSLKRYFRVNVTPDLSHSGTDVAEVVTQVILGGARALPAV